MDRLLARLERPLSAAALRRAALEELMRATGATCAGAHGLCWDEDGRLRISGVAGAGLFAEDARLLELSGQPYDRFVADEAELIEAVVSFEQFALHRREDLPPLLVERLWRPLGITCGISLNVEDRGRFVDNVMAMRLEGEPPFTEVELAAAKPLRDLVKSLMRMAATLAPSAATDRAAFVLGLDGSLRLSAGDPSTLEDQGLVEELLAHARAMRASARTRSELVTGERLIEMLWMRGASEEALLVNVAPARSWIVPSVLQLPAAIRRVVAMAVRGATTNEIAAELGRSPETVRSHLKRAYATLGVSSRSELTTLVMNLSRPGG